MKALLVLLLGATLSLSFFARAQENVDSTDDSRKPAAATPSRPQYPGSQDEDELKVQERLPEAKVKLNSYTVQRQVYKKLYNQEQKDDAPETVNE